LEQFRYLNSISKEDGGVFGERSHEGLVKFQEQTGTES
jgi:hypothetical protein